MLSLSLSRSPFFNISTHYRSTKNSYRVRIFLVPMYLHRFGLVSSPSSLFPSLFLSVPFVCLASFVPIFFPSLAYISSRIFLYSSLRSLFLVALVGPSYSRSEFHFVLLSINKEEKKFALAFPPISDIMRIHNFFFLSLFILFHFRFASFSWRCLYFLTLCPMHSTTFADSEREK